MTIPPDETKDMNAALDKMRDKSKQLNDALKTLTEDGLERLSRAAAAKTRERQGAEIGDIARSELGRALQKELVAEMQGMVKAATDGGQGISVVINNNAGAQVSAAEKSDAMDRKYLEITIDQMVANSLMRGQQTSGVMRALFGLAPSLSGR